ncbi:hypothetical protein HZS_2316 [Henneguya salminicola]|nr:hypothetical protein HZS_2316 [Henneguya salminicola]
MYAKIEDIPPGDQTSHLLYHMGAETMEILNYLISPQNPEEKAIEEISKILSAHFEMQTNVIAERYNFWNMKQTENEKISDFILKLKSASKNCRFGTF